MNHMCGGVAIPKDVLSNAMKPMSFCPGWTYLSEKVLLIGPRITAVTLSLTFMMVRSTRECACIQS